MTTGNSNLYEYIGLAPNENCRSIVELLKVEKEGSYSDMNDEEIAYLMGYKEYKAKHDETIAVLRDESNAKLKALDEYLTEQRQKQRELFKQWFDTDSVFQSVKDNGGE